MTNTRDIEAANISAIEADVVRPLIFVRLDFEAGPLRAHNSVGQKTIEHEQYGTEIYDGVGELGSISDTITESTELTEQRYTIAISGVDNFYIATALTGVYHMRDAEIMIGLEQNDGSLAAPPVRLVVGWMDNLNVRLGQDFGTVEVAVTDRSMLLQKKSNLRHSDEDQQRLRPFGDGDKDGPDLSHEYIHRMANLPPLKWGDRAFQPPFTPRYPNFTRDNNPGVWPGIYDQLP